METHHKPSSFAGPASVSHSAARPTGSTRRQPSATDSSPTPASPHHVRTGTNLLSEHGHSYGLDALHRIAPMAVHSGASVASFFNGLFQTILAIGTLGASITFNYVLSNAAPADSNDSNVLDTPNNTGNGEPRFSAPTVQLFLSISWLLFLLGLAFASLGQTLLTFFRKHWERDWDGVHGRTSQVTVQWYAVLAAVLMGSLVIGAFALLCLVVVAYSPVVGWIALGFTGFFGAIIVVAVVNQVPWPCKWKRTKAWTPNDDVVKGHQGRSGTV
ncbi:uncharacterized protein HMPREF1541_02169 [Cyphellophora europaea CBS 101466]|uniref:Uncharacterized protein n=1 Tax=Cyphellophora europaea (strain CBS 101466) TaxID=1220924 RepID=W2S2S0_CYPE1|nr:uncharacterized protein HMPREF1541_02169 [Cyphellophora europaea CBS 101466]ETN43011.1 hypothetical protein HMPREF1541_02169 [Cyphellophora europaea CBS 101466]